MRKLIWLSMLVITFGAAWWIVSPGVLTIQPIGAMPEGATVIYYARGPGLPLFASPDGMCLQLKGGVSLWCRATAIAGFAPLADRMLIRLPYIHAAYLLSTGGKEFD